MFNKFIEKDYHLEYKYLSDDLLIDFTIDPEFIISESDIYKVGYKKNNCWIFTKDEKSFKSFISEIMYNAESFLNMLCNDLQKEVKK